MRPADNDLLCRVEGEAPMGQIMRQHWLPACMSEEVAEADGTPVRTRLLGEDLVVFRDSKGRIGVLDEHCPHRGASLAFGRNEDCGLRCLYHGWKFGVDGEIQEMASEPADSRMRNLKHKAYPTAEGGGFVWVWMGSEETLRPFEPPAWAPTPTTKTSIVKMHAACNWAQVLEGSIDSAHSSSLHSTNMPTAEVAGSTATETCLAAPLQRQGAAPGGRAHRLRLPLRRHPPADRRRRDPRLHPHDGLHRAVHGADPAERPVQPGSDAGPHR
jgi:phthalate 4,5-dioxygenase oxygenase subunit